VRLVASNHGERGARETLSAISWRPVRGLRATVLRRFRLPAVAGRGRRSVRLRIALPTGAGGAFLVRVCLNIRATVRERRATNNCRSAGQVAVAEAPAPDSTPAPAPVPTEPGALPGLPLPGTPTEPPDTTPPQTTIDAAPPVAAGTNVATFWFSANERSRFECRLDGGAWATCSSPQQYTGLPEGPHELEVRAIDVAGNVDPSPAVHAWTVDRTRPQTTITGAPPSSTTSTEAEITFGSDDPTATFQCRLDAAPWIACVSPVALTGLAVGEHSFEVSAIDPAGNQDTSPAIAAWTVELP
jgi:hypothetical protein